MSACSTCGFCVRNESIAFYGNPASEVVLSLAMLASGLNFSILFMTFVRGSRRNIFKNETARAFLTMVGIAIVIVTFDLILKKGLPILEALREASFQIASLSTTTGFATADTTTWPPMSIAILVICSLVCGCSGSTSGGIKFDRVYLACKDVFTDVKKKTSPARINLVHIGGKPCPDTEIQETLAFIFLYFLIILAFAVINSAGGLDIVTSFTASAACIGNVGPGFGEVGSMSNYAFFPDWLKLSSVFEMLLGRLEIFPVLYLLRDLYLEVRD